MSEVYILEVSCEDDFDSSRFIFDSEKSAMYAAMDEIADIINFARDPNQPELMKEFDKVSNFIRSNKFLAALDAYNEIPNNMNGYCGYMYVTVFSQSIRSQHTRKILLNEEKVITTTEATAVLPAAKIREEFSCPHCSRMNDVGVNVCWNCGNSI